MAGKGQERPATLSSTVFPHHPFQYGVSASPRRDLIRSSLLRCTVWMALAVMGPSAARAGPMQFRISSIVTPDGRVATDVNDINASGQMLAVIDDSQYLVNPDFSIVRKQGAGHSMISGKRVISESMIRTRPSPRRNSVFRTEIFSQE
jgi:hypothetical protein